MDALHDCTKRRFRPAPRRDRPRPGDVAVAQSLRGSPGLVSILARGAARRPSLRALALGLVVAAVLTAPTGALARDKRLRPPPDVLLHPDRGMPFSRFAKTTHDQRSFKPFNQGTRLPVMDASIDPYNLGAKPSYYDVRSGLVRNSITDNLHDMKRNEQAAHKVSVANGDPQKKSTEPKPRLESWQVKAKPLPWPPRQKTESGQTQLSALNKPSN